MDDLGDDFDELKDSAVKGGDPGASNTSAANGEKVKKKRGRKPKSFYLEQQKEQERVAREQAEARK